MKKVIFVGVLLLLVAAFTCPSREMHTTAIVEKTQSMLNEELSDESASFFEKGLAKIGSAIGSSVVEYVLDNMLTVNNYFVCSVGKVTVDADTQVVSFGMFNYVYTNIPNELKQALSGKK